MDERARDLVVDAGAFIKMTAAARGIEPDDLEYLVVIRANDGVGAHGDGSDHFNLHATIQLMLQLPTAALHKLVKSIGERLDATGEAKPDS